jgi:hypothetical protein
MSSVAGGSSVEIEMRHTVDGGRGGAAHPLALVSAARAACRTSCVTAGARAGLISGLIR